MHPRVCLASHKVKSSLTASSVQSRTGNEDPGFCGIPPTASDGFQIAAAVLDIESPITEKQKDVEAGFVCLKIQGKALLLGIKYKMVVGSHLHMRSRERRGGGGSFSRRDKA